MIPEQTYTLNHVQHVAELHSAASELEPSTSMISQSLEEGRAKLIEQGFGRFFHHERKLKIEHALFFVHFCDRYDPESFFEQRVVWGDMDPFR